MNVRELKEIIADLPDAMEVYIYDLKVEDLKYQVFDNNLNMPLPLFFFLLLHKDHSQNNQYLY